MFIIAVLKKPEEANLKQKYRSELSSLRRKFYFRLIQAFNKLLSLIGSLLPDVAIQNKHLIDPSLRPRLHKSSKEAHILQNYRTGFNPLLRESFISYYT